MQRQYLELLASSPPIPDPGECASSLCAQSRSCTTRNNRVRPSSPRHPSLRPPYSGYIVRCHLLPDSETRQPLWHSRSGQSGPLDPGSVLNASRPKQLLMELAHGPRRPFRRALPLPPAEAGDEPAFRRCVHFPFGLRGSMLSRGSTVLGRQRSDSPGAAPGSSLSSTAMHSSRVGPALRML